MPTSKRTSELATELGVPLVGLDEIDDIDIDVDGADEVDPSLDLIKGHGGALVRERVVASISKRFVILAGEEKRVPRLGARMAVPVEVVPFAAPVCQRGVEALGGEVRLRMDADGRPFVSDNGNHILDAKFQEIEACRSRKTHRCSPRRRRQRSLRWHGRPGAVSIGVEFPPAIAHLTRAMSGPFVELRNVSKKFAAEARPVLDRVSFRVEPGETLVLLGSSGAGKTTALRTINRLVEPDEGEVEVEGREVREWDPIRLRRRTGYVIQDVGLFPHLSVAENVELIPKLEGWSRGAAAGAGLRAPRARGSSAGAIRTREAQGAFGR